MKKRIVKPKKSNKIKYGIILISLFLVSIMIFSVLEIGQKLEVEQYKYKNFLFVKVDKGWFSHIGDKNILLSYDPKSLENISINKVYLADLNSAQKIYFSRNPQENLYQAIYEFQVNIIPLINIPIVPACTEDVPECGNIPLKNCKDATQNTRIIIFKEDKTTKVSYEDNCLVIQGNKENLTKASDKLILTLLGI